MSAQRQLVLAVVTDINPNKVTYPSCTQCYTKLLIDPTTQRYHCIKCSISVPCQSVQWRYRLVLTVADNTAICQVVVFGRTLEQFFGKTGTDFHRSLVDLDRSGYPAEDLLTEALNKTFHGKYFYFGVKLPSSHNTKTAPTLLCLNQGCSGPSQSLLNNTDVLETSNILVYQMIPSNDGVYATVSDFVRQGIKHLRQTSDRSVYPENDVNPSAVDLSLECGINQSIETSESSLYKTGSFNIKQQSVALSFETSTEESVEISRSGNLTDTIAWNEDMICLQQSHDLKYIKAGSISELCKNDTGNYRHDNVVTSFDKSFLEEGNLNEERNIISIDKDYPIAACLSFTDGSDIIQRLKFTDDEVQNGETERLIDKLNHIDLPDSEDLEMFLNSFSTSLHISEGGIQNISHKISTNWKENSLNGERKITLIDSHRPITTYLSITQRCDVIQSLTCADDQVKNEATERSINKLQSIDLPDSEDLEAFLNSFSSSFHNSDEKCIQNTCDSTSLSNLYNGENKEEAMRLEESLLCRSSSLNSTMISQSAKQQDNESDRKREHIYVGNTAGTNNEQTANGPENSCDSGLQLSTSSCDLFVSPGLFPAENHIDPNMESKKSAVYCTSDINYGNMKDRNKFLEEEFNDSWSELVQNELSQNMTDFQIDRQENQDKSNMIIKTSPKEYNTCTSMGGTKQVYDIYSPTIKQSVHTESLLNATDILFDSPETSVSKETYMFDRQPKDCIYSLNKAAVTTFLSQSNNMSSVHQRHVSDFSSNNKREDDSVVEESQSTLFESDKSLSKSCIKEKSTVGVLGVGKKVMFSKKLRRVSSCRLMDIKMKESKPSAVKVVNPKSCLKPSVQVCQNKIEFDYVNKGVNVFLLDESDNSGSDSSFFIESSQPSNVKKPVFLGQHTGNLLQENVMLEYTDDVKDKETLPSTPELWSSSFDDCSFSGVLNEAITIETPASTHRTIQKNSKVFDGNGIYVFCGKDIENNSNSKTLRLSRCVSSTPELFCETSARNSQHILPENSAENYENKENLNKCEIKNPADKAKPNGSKNIPIFKCIVENTPGCDNTVISKIPSNSSNKDDYSPDLFCDSSFEDCDNNLNDNLYVMPSVLCKQLFF